MLQIGQGVQECISRGGRGFSLRNDYPHPARTIYGHPGSAQVGSELIRATYTNKRASFCSTLVYLERADDVTVPSLFGKAATDFSIARKSRALDFVNERASEKLPLREHAREVSGLPAS